MARGAGEKIAIWLKKSSTTAMQSMLWFELNMMFFEKVREPLESDSEKAYITAG